MQMTAEAEGDPVRRGREWTVTARITVCMTSAEYDAMDGLRYEAFPWVRFRILLRSPGPEDRAAGAWQWEVRDSERGEDENPVVSAGTGPSWDAAVRAARFALLDAREAAWGEAEQDAAGLPRPGGIPRRRPGCES